MEVELVTEGTLEEETLGFDDNNDDSTFEGERCGICMDIVIDRGVLDCCQHWFCFACIDNWATITNLCPLCQNEFQLITCVPVYDTIGTYNADDDLHSGSGDDDWCIEGKNNTLSFPSYYIDENAVICLDGDGCKVRSRSVAIVEDSNLDTSIACDSCDVWYHAFCVGFDPEGTCENSWLCPRCVDDEMPQKSDGLPVHGLENTKGECLVEAAFSGKVSVSVADAGETAVVVSLVEGKQGTEESSRNFLSSLDVCKELEVDTPKPSPDDGETAIVVSKVEGNQGHEGKCLKSLSSLDICRDTKTDMLLSSCPDNHKLETPSSDVTSIQPNLRTQELELSLSKVTSFNAPSNSLDFPELKTNSDDKGKSRPSAVDGFGVSSSKALGKLHVNKMSKNLAEDQVSGDVRQKHSSGECLLPVHSVILDKKENVIETTGAKRKRRDWRGVENGEAKAKIGTRVSAKKVKAEKKNQLIHSKDLGDKSAPDDPTKSPSLPAAYKDDKLESLSDKENVSTGIMDIVHGTYRRPLKRSARSNLAGTSSTEREKAAGLRVKKIMRRSTEDKESSLLVQKLRKEIRDAVRNKSSKELGDNLYDPKLLAAFRAVVARPMTETKRPPPLDVRAKKSLLQKGKIRESLTKKIYGIGGRRKRAWTRDCEIEFWKHRCLKVGKPEKIETLKSVLSLLRTNSESKERKQESESGPTAGSILSRLYLADASVFPRKNDIKPLSALKDTEQKKECTSNVLSSQAIVPSADNIGTKSNDASIKSEASSIKVHSNRRVEGPSGSTVGGSKANSEKETGKSDDIRTDKRKWALQVLARKTAVAGKNAAQEEDNAVLKGNCPLLAQLPVDMRPVLAPNRHNKIPISVRQAQLHRLTEHFLKKANMPVTRRTAEIELAIADAVNIEKEVADRSSSKLVYVNLCSQELLRRSDNIILDKVTESNPNPDPAVPTEKLDEATKDLSSFSEVDEALRNAGLLSDSPPNSPHHEKEETDKVGPSKNMEDGPDNVFEIDSQPELDIYGDFEYDLEDEEFVGASALKIAEPIPEESKMKMVFSTLDSDRSNGAQEAKDPARQTVLEEPKDPTETSIVSSSEDHKTDECPSHPLPDEGCEEPSFAECEELYGPDKEPLMKRFPETASIKPCKPIPENVGQGDNEDQGPSGGKDSPNPSQKNASRKEKTSNIDDSKKSDSCNYVRKKVEAYIKEHIRPLCKSGVITVEQYRWAVGKTTDKIMKYHSKDTNANFLIKEGEKVKRLAEQYVETAQSGKK